MKIYGVYDIKNKEQCCFCGNAKEVASFLEMSENTLRSEISRKIKVKNKYEVIGIEEDN